MTIEELKELNNKADRLLQVKRTIKELSSIISNLSKSPETAVTLAKYATGTVGAYIIKLPTHTIVSQIEKELREAKNEETSIISLLSAYKSPHEV